MTTVDTFDRNLPVTITTSAIAARVAARALTLVGCSTRVSTLERDLIRAVRDRLSEAADTAVETDGRTNPEGA